MSGLVRSSRCVPSGSGQLQLASRHAGLSLREGTSTSTSTSTSRRYGGRVRRPQRLCQCSATGDGTATASQTKKVVILGGTGRVGSATAAALVRETRKNMKNSDVEKGEDENNKENSSSPAMPAVVEVVIAGRRPEKVQSVRESWPDELSSVQYEPCDINDPESLDRVLGGADLVVHAAGPFQQTSTCSVLEAAIRNGVAYLDVCDDAEHTKRAKRSLGQAAEEKGIPAVVSCGVYPGLSNVMASYMCDAGSPYPEHKATKLRFSYFTAGSGGVGSTILATSFLLLGEKATAFVDGKRKDGEPYSERNVVEFGQKLGKREVFNLNLPEVFTAHEVLGVPSVSAYFGTSPGVWNFMMQMMARLLPESLLQNRSVADGLAQVVMPLVVAVDYLVGKTTAMRIDVKYDNGKTSSSLFINNDTAFCAGTSTAAFAIEILKGKVPAGVHYPEERCVIQDYESFFQLCSDKCNAFAVSQAPWRLEQVPSRMIMGMYW